MNRSKTSASWPRRALGVAAALASGLLLVIVIQMQRAGHWLQPTQETRLEAFDRLWRLMEDQYPYFEIKGVDGPALRDDYRPRIAAAPNDGVYFTLLAEMLDALGDGHTGVLSPYPDVACYAATREIEGQAVVVTIGPSATAAGLAVGDVVQTVDGRSVADALAALDPRLRTGSTERGRRRSAFDHLLCGPSQGVLRATVADRDSGQRVVDLQPLDRPAAPATPIPAVTWRRLPEGVGVIALRRLFGDDGQDLVADFDAALAALADTPGLILDLRGNGGGNSTLGDAIAGRFVAAPGSYGQEWYRQRLPFRLWSLNADYAVTPRGSTYGGRLVVIIDTGVGSSAEQLVAALVEGAGVMTVGRPSAGSSGNPMRVDVRGGQVRFSTGDFRRQDGTPIEGVGFAPDIAVAWSIDDVHTGRDPDVEAALQILSRSIQLKRDD